MNTTLWVFHATDVGPAAVVYIEGSATLGCVEVNDRYRWTNERMMPYAGVELNVVWSHFSVKVANAVRINCQDA